MAILNAFKKRLLDGNVNMSSGGDTIKVALLTSTHTTNIDTQEFWSNVSVNEISGTGYTAGGETLANQTTSQDNTDDEGVFDGDDVVWTAATITSRYAVVYKDTGVAATSPIIRIIDFTSDQIVSGADFTIQWDAEGILNLN